MSSFVSKLKQLEKSLDNLKIALDIMLEVIAMMGIFLFSIFCFFWLIGFSLLAEIWFYEEEQQL